MIGCRGKYYAMNVPLKDGIDDQSYAALFRPVMSKLVEVYQPQAVVFQSGMDTPAYRSSSAILHVCC